MASHYKQQLLDWVAQQEVKADTVFDVGGSQDPIKGRTKSWDVKNYKIIDLPQPHVLKQKPDIEWDMNDEWLESPHDGQEADVIFMLGVMDYIINPNIAMRNISLMLKMGGHAWVEFPFFYATHEPVSDEGCRYSEGCIKRLAVQASLEITDIVRKMERSGLLIRWFAEEGQRAARSYPYHGVTGFIVKLEKYRAIW